MANIPQGLQLGALEFYFEAGFYGDNEVDVIQGIPFRYVSSLHFGCRYYGLIIEYLVEDFGEPLIDLFSRHEYASIMLIETGACRELIGLLMNCTIRGNPNGSSGEQCSSMRTPSRAPPVANPSAWRICRETPRKLRHNPK
jgi:hypothetical protein